MLATYVAVTVVAAIAYANAAVLNFAHNKSIAETGPGPVPWTVTTLDTDLRGGGSGGSYATAVFVRL